MCFMSPMKQYLMNFWNWISEHGFRSASVQNETLGEKILLTNRFAIVISFFTVFYTVMYYILGQWTTFMAGIAATGCMWFSIYLNSHSYFWLSRHIVVTASVLVVFMSDITFNFKALVDFYYLPCMLMAFLLFHRNDVKSLISLSLMPVIFWLIPRIFNLTIPSFNEPLSMYYMQVFSYTNPIGAFIITSYFAYLFVFSISEYEKRLSIANKFSAIGEMSGNIVHEINNPLAVVVLKLQLVKNQFTSPNQNLEKITNHLASVDVALGRIQKIINGLKITARSSDTEPLSNASTVTIVTEAIDMVSERFSDDKVKISIQNLPDLQIICRPYQLVQVLVNLFNNSRDAIKELQEKWIRIDVVTRKNSVQFIVEDSGLGIPEQIASKIMQPFFTTKSVGKGTGIGLSLSKKIAEQHGGKLFLDSDRRHTCFILEIPFGNIENQHSINKLN